MTFKKWWGGIGCTSNKDLFYFIFLHVMVVFKIISLHGKSLGGRIQAGASFPSGSATLPGGMDTGLL